MHHILKNLIKGYLKTNVHNKVELKVSWYTNITVKQQNNKQTKKANNIERLNNKTP